MAPPMKLTAEQMMDIAMEMHRALANAAWEGLERPWTELTPEELEAILAPIRETQERHFVQSDRKEAAQLHAEMMARLTVDGVRRAAAEEPLQRAEWLKNERGG